MPELILGINLKFLLDQQCNFGGGAVKARFFVDYEMGVSCVYRFYKLGHTTSKSKKPTMGGRLIND